MERLRYVARAGDWLAPAELALEAVWALADLAEEDPSALAVSARGLLSRRPEAGCLWWVVTCILTAHDVYLQAEQCARAIGEDPTDSIVEGLLAGGGPIDVLAPSRAVRPSSGVAVVDALALAPAGVLARAGSGLAARAMESAGGETWLRAASGSVVPPAAWDLINRISPALRDGQVEVVPLEVFTRAVSPEGLGDPPVVAESATWSLPPELAGIAPPC